MAYTRYILFSFFVLALAPGCKGPTGEDQSGPQEGEYMGVQSLLWYQRAAETDALYLQGYNLATDRILEYNRVVGAKPPAVVLDIDETVLDNSPFNVDMLRKGYAYSEEKWAAWCEMRKALPLPGALGFTHLADSLGVEVYYVSNRAVALMDATLDNLQLYGFPNADADHVLLKTSTSSKDARRAAIRENHEIILLLGDNLGDFEGIFDDRSENYGKLLVGKHSEAFGRKFIVFPNPIYGGWVRAALGEGMPSEREVLDQLRGYGQ